MDDLKDMVGQKDCIKGVFERAIRYYPVQRGVAVRHCIPHPLPRRFIFHMGVRVLGEFLEELQPKEAESSSISRYCSSLSDASPHRRS
jgi:hypothetical protein